MRIETLCFKGLLNRPLSWQRGSVNILFHPVISGIHTVIFGHSRYHLSLIPILCLYGASAIQSKSWKRLGEKTWCARGAITVSAVLVSIWIWEVMFMETARIQQFFEVILG